MRRISVFKVLFFSFVLSIISFIAPAYAGGCDAVDTSSVSSVLACLKETEEMISADKTNTQTLLQPMQSCTKVRHNFLHERYLKAKHPDRYRKMVDQVAIDEIIENELGGENFLPCETVSDLIKNVSGQPPLWANCLGYEDAVNKTDFAISCMTNFYARQHAHNIVKHPELYLGRRIEVSYPRSCKSALLSLDQVFKYVRDRDNTKKSSSQYLPDNFEDLDCAQLEPLFVAGREAKKESHQESKKRYAEKMQYMKENNIKPINIMKEMEKASRDRDERWRISALDAFKAKQHPADKLDRLHMRYAIVAQLHEMYPEETTSLGWLQGRLVHTSGGIQSSNASGGGMVVNYGVRSIKDESCKITKSGQATCTFKLTMSPNARAPGLGYDNNRKMLETMVNTLDVIAQNGTFEVNFKHNGQQWRLDNPSKEFVEFLQPRVPEAPKKKEGYSPEECLMLDSWGASLC